MAQLIYIIEDDENIRDLIKIALESYSYEVCAFEYAEEALLAMRKRKPDLAVFDIMLPQMDGITAVKQIRKVKALNNLPIIMLTAKDTEIDKVTGLDCGADDYMTKPFGILELSARIRSLLRRCAKTETAEQEEEKTLQLGGISLDQKTREVFRDQKAVELTYKEFELLKYLMENSNRVASRDELLNHIWGYDYIGETRTLDMHIRSLRQKLGDDSNTYIKTVRGVGYRFAPQNSTDE